MPYLTNKEVEERFEETFVQIDRDGVKHISGVDVEYAKDFITSIRTQDLEDIKEWVEGNKRMESDYEDEDKRSRRDVGPYNAALFDLTTYINSLKSK